jgi:hypothetical protein
MNSTNRENGERLRGQSYSRFTLSDLSRCSTENLMEFTRALEWSFRNRNLQMPCAGCVVVDNQHVVGCP